MKSTIQKSKNLFKSILFVSLLTMVSFTSCSKDDDDDKPNHPNNNNGSYAIGDVYYLEGKAMGVVYKTSNGGKNGSIISLDEASALTWGPLGNRTEAQDKWGGKNLMAKIKKFDNEYSKYPAFRWCANKGEGWYLPSVHELQAIYAVYNGAKFQELTDNKEAKDLFNQQLKSAKAVPFGAGEYWSSTESCGNNGFSVIFARGSQRIIKKNITFKVRAVYDF